MVPACPSDGYHAEARHPSSSGAHEPNSTDGESYSHFREDTPVLLDSRVQPRRKSSRMWSSVARAFLQRTMACLKRQPKQASQNDSTLLPGRGPTTGQDLSPSDGSPRRIGRNVFPSLTRLVLKRTDDVSFSPSSFFRTVEEVRSLGHNATYSTALSPPLPPCRPPRRYPLPPVDGHPAPATPCTPPLSQGHTSNGAQAAPRKSSTRTEFDSMLELQTLATELEKLDPLLVNTPPLAPHRLHASPSIKSSSPRSPLWSTSPPAALNLSCDPLAELLAVAEELKTMKNPDSDDILYMTDAPPPSPLPPTLHAFLDAPGASLRILEMDIHSQDEMFLGIPIPCIVVTSEGDALPTAALEVLAPPPSPSEDLLAPPPTTYRGRIETDQPPISDECDCDSPSPSLCSCEGIIDGKVEVEGSLSSPCDCSGCPLGGANLSWEAINIVGSSAPCTQYTKPRRPTAPKPTPLLRRRESSLLRSLLRSSDVININAPSTEKDRPQCIRSKQKWKRIPKEAIGSPLPLSPSQAVTILPHFMNLH